MNNHQLGSVLRTAIQQLTQYSPSAQLDAEILLAHVLQVSRSYLLTWPETELHAEHYAQFLRLIERRCKGEPIAYIVGYKEFWSLPFKVTPATLIPRPETELLVELALQKFNPNISVRIADLGTGPGTIGIALAYERPTWLIYATDCSADALTIAQHNAAVLQIKNIHFYQGNWCEALPNKEFHMIISNPPYIAERDPHLLQSEIRYEPQTALVSGRDGLRDIKIIIEQARSYLIVGGWLLLEHGYQQAAAVKALMILSGYAHVLHYHDLAGNLRVTVAQYQGIK